VQSHDLVSQKLYNYATVKEYQMPLKPMYANIISR